MAEKVSAAGKEPSKRKKSGGAGMGHNTTEIRKKAEAGFKALATLQEDMETAMGEFRSDFASKYESLANEIGCSRKVIRTEFRRYIYNMREEARERELEAVERDEIETLRASLEGTPFGQYVAGKLAKPAKETGKAN